MVPTGLAAAASHRLHTAGAHGAKFGCQDVLERAEGFQNKGLGCSPAVGLDPFCRCKVDEVKQRRSVRLGNRR